MLLSLRTTIDDLISHLSSVLPPAMYDEAVKLGSPEVSPASELRNNIDNIVAGITEQEQRLRYIIDRLEI